jgi:NTP pyrophosphatase (non-canonical NTP hydrolase)
MSKEDSRPNELPIFAKGERKSFSTLSREVSKWASYNWPDEMHFPHLGLGEEAGELTHGVLKAAQKIRSGADPTKSLAEIRDAIGDCGIYAMHLAGKHFPDRVYNDGTFHPDPDFNVRYSCGDLLVFAGNIICAIEDGSGFFANTQLTHYLNELNGLAEHFGLNFLTVVNEIWDEVSLRDWRKFPVNGLTE